MAIDMSIHSPPGGRVKCYNEDMSTRVKFGCMGFAYREWIGPFYRPGTSNGEMLRQYARCFRCVELDTTFYAPPRESTVEKWFEATPADFTFAAKVWQRITHEKQFVDATEDLDAFVRSVAPLRPKLGPLLIQCPPDLTVESLPAFRAFARTLSDEFRWAVEFRHRSWFSIEVYDMLKARNICLVAADLYYMPRVLDRTAEFAYVRLLGNRRKIVDIGKVVKDRTEDVARWATEITNVIPDPDEGWVFANNHYSGFSPHTIGILMRDLRLEEPVFPVHEPPEQPSLF